MNEKSFHSSSGGFLCLGFFLKFFGTITLRDGTVPTRSRAKARTSFFALYGFGFRILPYKLAYKQVTIYN
jgi:hypothetical protein